MSIQTKIRKKKGKDVTYYFPVVYAKPYTNEDKYIWGKGYLRKSDAKTAEATILKDLEKNKSASPYVQKKEKVLFKNVRKSWLDTRVAKEDSTADRDTAYCEIYLSLFDDMDIKKIDAVAVQKWVTLLASKYAPKTTNMAFNLLSQIMDYAKSPLKIINSNPCKENIQKPSNKNKGIESDKFWTEEELVFFMNHPFTKEDSYFTMYLIHSTFGMRPGEVCGISIRDINLKTRLLTLNYGIDKKKRLTDLKNTGAQRSLKVPIPLIQPLKEQIAYSNGVREKNAKYPFLFVIDKGTPINPDTYCQHFQRLIDRINKNSEDMHLKPITPYGLRHTFATLSLLKGTHIKVVAEIMGDSEETVMKNYAHITDQMTGYSLELMASTILNNG